MGPAMLADYARNIQCFQKKYAADGVFQFAALCQGTSVQSKVLSELSYYFKQACLWGFDSAPTTVSNWISTSKACLK